MEKEKKRYRNQDDFQWVSDFFNDLISPHDIEISKRLIDRKEEMKSVYEEIDKKMAKLSPPLGIIPDKHADSILWAIIDGAVLYDKKAAKDTRERYKRL